MAAAESAQNSNGQNYGSYAPAFAGQLEGEGQQQGFQAALAANQQQYNDVIQGNQAFYQGPGALAQQQDNLMSSNVQAANLANSANQNQFDLDSAQQQNGFNLNSNANPNAFNLANYGNEYERNQYNNQLWTGAGGALGSVGGGFLSAL